MNKLSILLISAMLLLSACNSGSTPEANNNPSPTPNLPQNQVSNQGKEPQEQFTDKTKSTPSNSISGLIPSTSPQERLNKISQGKGDPFGSIKPPSVIKVASNNTKSTSNLIGVNKAVVRQNSVATSNNNSSNKSLVPTLKDTTVKDKVMEEEVKQTPLLKIPKPVDAEKILVSGILDLQGENVALVTTPWDGTTLSVRVGDVISDSSGSINVQVKDIAFNNPNNVVLQEDNQIIYRDLNDPNGVVVLEQHGQLVRREVTQEVQEEENLEEL